MSVLALNKPDNVRLIAVLDIEEPDVPSSPIHHEFEPAFSPESLPPEFEPVFNAGAGFDGDVSLAWVNNRNLPYIKGIFDYCSTLDCDIFGYMNSDILIRSDFFDFFDGEKDAYFFYRNEIEKTTASAFNSGSYKKVWGGDKHPGNDAFFFDRNWWHENSGLFPDSLILGETEWDTAYRVIVKNEASKYDSNRSLYHVYHDQIWNTVSNGAKHNIAIWKEIRKKYKVLS
jgi:hypothetical protein